MTEAVEKKSTLVLLIECLAKYEGLTTAKELAVRTGRDVSNIRKAMKQANMPAGKYASEQANMPENGQMCPPKQANMPVKASRTRAQKEYPSGISPNEDNVISFYDPNAKRCWIEKETDKLRLCDELYNYWSDKFGSAEFLDLALIQAKPYIQPKSGRPLETQVSAQLARNLQNKLQGDKRYSDACKANGRNQPKASADEWSKVLSEMGAQ